MKRLILSLLAALSVLSAYAQVPNIIFDTDQGNDIDDALALDVLYKLADEGSLNILGITLSKEGTGPVGYVQIANKFYGYPKVPVGKVLNGAFDPNDHSVNYAAVVTEMKDEDGRPLFKRSGPKYDKLPEAHILMRKLLSKADDKSVTIASVGFFTNLKRLYESSGDKYSPLSGRELIERKVKSLVIVAGVFNEHALALHEYNVVNDIPAARLVFEKWPTPVVSSPWELGILAQYPGEQLERDLAWAQPHPLVEAYKCYLPMPYTRPMWDDTAVLFAAGQEGWFSISPNGNIAVNDEGSTIFTEDPAGTRRHIRVTPEQAIALRDYLVGLIARPRK